MPPRHAYWTILVDDQPTAFRAHDPEDLRATLNRLKEKHPSAVMKWFERGRLFDSREAAREEGLGQGERRWEGERPADGPRDRNWRPGGEHRDPRQRFKDAKKARWQRFKQNIRERHQRDERPPRRPEEDPRSFTPPHGDPLRHRPDRPEGPRESRRGNTWSGQRDKRSPKPTPHGDRPFPGGPRGDFRGRDRPDRDRRDDRRGNAREPWSEPRQDRERDQWRSEDGRDRRGPQARGGFGGKKPHGVPKPWTFRPGETTRGRKPWGTNPGKSGSKPGGKGFGPRGPNPARGRGPGPGRRPKKPRDDGE